MRRGKVKGKRLVSMVCRRFLMQRAKGRCERCGCRVRYSYPAWHPHRAHVNHIKPRSLGGTDDIENLEVICQACHLPDGQHAPTPERMAALSKPRRLKEWP